MNDKLLLSLLKVIKQSKIIIVGFLLDE